MTTLFALAIHNMPAIAATDVPDFIALQVPNAIENGHGRYKYMMMDIYDAKLYTPDDGGDTLQPMALSLNYHLALSGKKIAMRSIQEIRSQGFTDEARLSAWQEAMISIFPDVRDGTVLTGIVTVSGEALFYKDDILLGKIDDKEFAPHFFGIWLDERTSAPDLRATLLGNRQQAEM